MNLELTSRCTLGCPGCPRTWFENLFKMPFPKQDLDLGMLERFLDCESGHQVSKFVFNGNHGDPIYYPDLLTLMTKYRESKCFTMSTNGSYQLPRFWQAFADLLTDRDTVYFSIDGLEHNNHLYRRNSDWTSIMQAIDIVVKSPAQVVWKSLIFKYNQDDIDAMRQRAEDLGLIFVADVTHRFGDNSLIPDKTDQHVKFSNENLELDPQCSRLEYVSADGYYWPCCFVSSMFSLHQTSLWKNRDKWHIGNQNLDQARRMLSQWEHQVRSEPISAHDICKMHCKKNQIEPVWTTLDR